MLSTISENLPLISMSFPKLASSLIISRMSNEVGSDEDKSRLISLAEAAEIYGFNVDYLRQLALKGRLEARKVGKFWVTTPSHVETYIHSRQKMGAYRSDIEVS